MGEEGALCPICLGASDAFGDHQVGCGGNGDRIHRHDSIRDALFSAAQTAALAPRKEAPSLIPGSSSRPADVYLPNWKRGKPAAPGCVCDLDHAEFNCDRSCHHPGSRSDRGGGEKDGGPRRRLPFRRGLLRPACGGKPRGVESRSQPHHFQHWPSPRAASGDPSIRDHSPSFPEVGNLPMEG